MSRFGIRRRIGRRAEPSRTSRGRVAPAAIALACILPALMSCSAPDKGDRSAWYNKTIAENLSFETPHFAMFGSERRDAPDVSLAAVVPQAATPPVEGDLLSSEASCGGVGLQAGRVEVDPSRLRNVSLNMTECDVVRLAGSPSRIEMSSDGGVRRMTLTYLTPTQQRIYRFSGGRLVSIEAGAIPVALSKRR